MLRHRKWFEILALMSKVCFQELNIVELDDMAEEVLLENIGIIEFVLNVENCTLS